jgi:hypothetical protein
VSHACIRQDVKKLDPLFFRGLLVGLDDAEQRRARRLIDAFNSIKQAYVSARYMAWLAISEQAPLREEMSEIRKRVTFLDTLEYGRFGIRTGLAVHAFTAATNVLDQVAGFVHLYLASGRVRDVYFRSLWRRDNRKRMDVALAARLQPDAMNRGLLALCDLATDLQQDTPLAHLLEQRHAATHRFLVVHDMLAEHEDGEWLQHVGWSSFCAQSIQQLKFARSALIYLARLIECEEAQRSKAEPHSPWPLPVYPTDADLAEIG